MLRAIEIAHVLIKEGQKPTEEGIKRAFKKPAKPDLSGTDDFYNRPNECLIDDSSQSIDFYTSMPSASNSNLGDREKLVIARGRLQDPVPYLSDDDVLILNKKFRALPKTDKRMYKHELLKMKLREPYRHEYLSKLIEEDDKLLN